MWEAQVCQGQLPAAKLLTGKWRTTGNRNWRDVGRGNAPSLPPSAGPSMPREGEQKEREVSALGLQLCWLEPVRSFALTTSSGSATFLQALMMMIALFHASIQYS